jgi:phage shock protein C
MQRIIQINIASRIIPIEEDAYNILKDYLNTLERQFTGDEGYEIVQDIENRIAELFLTRLQTGSPAIDRSDVQKVMDTLGAPGDLNEFGSATNSSYTSGNYNNTQRQQTQQQQGYTYDRLLRNPYDKIIGGVCSGVANYFDVDPVIIRIVMVALFFTFGVGFLAYIIAWIVIPAARTPQELRYMSGNPMTFHDITRNVQAEMTDLKKRGEQMSRELKDFFSKKK